MVSVCLENRIALYSPHTSWDNNRGSIGDWLARALPHKTSEVISPSPGDSNIGTGRKANVNADTPITLADSIERVKKHTGIKTVQVAIGVNSSLGTEIKSFAVCPGSGGSVLKGVPADLYITGKLNILMNNLTTFNKLTLTSFLGLIGEMSHHEVLEAAHNNVSVILCNHSNSERGYLKEFKDTLAKLLNDDSIGILISETDADPLVTY